MFNDSPLVYEHTLPHDHRPMQEDFQYSNNHGAIQGYVSANNNRRTNNMRELMHTDIESYNKLLVFSRILRLTDLELEILAIQLLSEIV